MEVKAVTINKELIFTKTQPSSAVANSSSNTEPWPLTNSSSVSSFFRRTSEQSYDVIEPSKNSMIIPTGLASNQCGIFNNAFVEDRRPNKKTKK